MARTKKESKAERLKRTLRDNRIISRAARRAGRESLQRAREKLAHPARKDHADQYVEAVVGTKDRQYASRMLDYIWWRRGKPPKRPGGMKKDRQHEIDSALYAIFATIR